MLNFKKALCGSTALVAAALVFGSVSPARAADHDITADATWASAAGRTGADIANATGGQTVDLLASANDVTLTIVSNGTASDHTGADSLVVFTVGAITNTNTDAGVGAVVVDASVGNNTTTIASVNIAGGFGVLNSAAGDADTMVIVTGGYSVALTTTVAGGAVEGNASLLQIGGNSTGTFVLEDNAAAATLRFSGAGAQSVAGTIDGDSAGEGTVGFSGAGAKAVSAVIGGTAAVGHVEVAGGTVTATGNITADTLRVGSGGELVMSGAAEIDAAVSIGTSGSLTVNTGTVAGDITGVVDGVGAVIFADNNTLGGNLGTAANSLASVSVAGTKTVAANTYNIDATTIAIGTTGHLVMTTGTITGAVTLAGADGTLTLGTGAMTGTIKGAADGQGILNLSGSRTLTGNIGATGFALAEVNVGTGADVVAGAYNILATDVAVDGTGTLEFTTGTITGDVALTGGGTLTMGSGAITGNVEIEENGELYLGTGGVTGTIDGDADGHGSVTFTASAATGGIIGGVHDLAAVYVSGGTLTVGHDILATDIVIGTAGTMSLGTAGTLTGDVHVAGEMGLTGDAGITGNLALANGTLDLGTHLLTATGNLIATGASEILFTIGTTAGVSGDLGLVDFDNSAGTLTITPTVSGFVVGNGDVVRLADVSGTLTLGTTTVASSGLVTWDARAGDGTETDIFGTTMAATDLVIEATVNSAASVGGVAAGNASSLDALMAVGTSPAGLVQLAAAAQSMTDGADVDQLGAQLRSDINGALQEASFGATNQVLGVIGARTDDIRLAQADSVTGVASGNSVKGLGAWIQGFGTSVDQGRRSGIDGFDANTYGVAVGADYRVMRNFIAGASFAYANTNLDDKGTRSRSGQDVNSYIGTLYGTYTSPLWYFDGSFSYGYHDYETKRYVTASNDTAKGDFGGNQFGVKAEFGYPVNVDRAVVTPFGSLAYNHLDLDGYTETGSVSNRRVDKTDTYSLRSGFGAKIAAKYNVDDWSIRPNARALWAHEFNSNGADITSSFVGAAGTTFKSNGMKMAQDAAIVGVGFDMMGTCNTTLSLKYDAEIKDQYLGHSGLIQIRHEF